WRSLTSIKVVHVVGNPGIGKAGSKSVIGAVWDHAGGGDAAIGIEINKVLLRWAADHSAENANALCIFGIRHAPDELINNSVHTPIGLNRQGIGCGGHSHARTDLLVERSELVPPPNLDGARQLTGLVILVACFSYQQRRRIESELESVIVADLRIARAARSGRVAIIDAEHESPCVIRLDCNTHARR